MFGVGGANLNYSDDELDSYSTILDGEVTDSGKADHKRVITALKNISEGKNPDKYMDIDNLLKYAAVHIFSANSDSLSGSIAHNYYLYESDGQLNLLPWDYNLAFGGMGMGRSGGVNRDSGFNNRDSGVSTDGGTDENGNPTIASTERRTTTVKATALSQTEKTTEEGSFPFGGQTPEGFDPSQFGGQQPPIGNEQPNGNDKQTAQGDGLPDSEAPTDGQNNTTEGGRPNRNNMSDFGNMSGKRVRDTEH